MCEKKVRAEQVIIAIDGPAGAGKSTVAQKLARRLGLGYLDTGAMYRALTLKALRERLDLDDERALARLASGMEVDTRHVEGKRPPYRVFMDGEDVTSDIRSREVSAHVSRVSSHPAVRKEMLRKQRLIAGKGGVVVEGRDVGTVVFPNADLKVFLTASTAERARRRYREMKREGYEVSLRTVQQEMVRRDRLDSTREVNPLRRAPDALLVDTTGLSASQVVNVLLRLAKSRLAE